MVLVLVVSAAVLTGIGLSIMTVTFGEIAKAFPTATEAQLSWIANLFTIVGAATLVPAGVFADRVGRRRMLLAGVALFTAGSFIGALAPNPATIMVARTVQALGASAYTPAAAAVLIAAFPAERLGTAIGVWAVTGGITASLGPSLGGLIVGWGGWRWAFWVNIPVGLFVLLLGPRYLPVSATDRSRAIPDPFGALLTMVAISAITLGVVQNKHDPGWEWTGAKTLLSITFGLVLLGWFLARCRTHASPLLDLDLFRIENVRVGVIGTFVIATVWFCIYWGIVRYAMTVWGWSPFKAGVATAPVSLFSGLLGIGAGRAANRLGHRVFILPGCVATALTALWFWFAMDSQPSLWSVVVPGSALLGIATGLVFPSFIAVTLHDMPSHRHAEGSGINFMTQRTGTTIGVALAITFLTGASGTDGLHQTLALAIAGSVICFAIGLRVDTRPAS
jgi:EmrB/QacA subfamily drug resistance transporter